MGRQRWFLAVFVALVAVFVACAPKSAPAPAPTPAAPQAAPGSPAPAVSTLSPEEAAWAQIVTAAKKEGKVTAYTFLFIGDTATAVGKAFEEKYGIKLELVTGGGRCSWKG